ncbi:MAG: aldose 1-epimerase, partial [Steroidobacteraceae bacterium]
MTDFLTIQHDAARLILAPHHGGAIRSFQWRGHDVLRPARASAGADPFEMACFPMVPYANRIAHGRFDFGGRTVRIERNWTHDPHPLHGQGWRAPWSIASATESSATLAFDGGADEWPWRYHCEQRFEIQQDGIAIELSLENRSVTPMPAMLGLHPYFPDAAHAELRARLPRVWMTDDAALPIEEVETPAPWAFDPARAVRAVPLDHGFSGWNGLASICWPDRTLIVRATHCRCLHVYVPQAQDYFCIEPQTAPPGALTRCPA